MKKFFSIFISLLCIFTCLLSISCGQDKLVIKESDTFVIINASSNQMQIDDETTLVDYMQSLKEDNLLDFNISGGMITSINGIDNPADWSSCWMIYTDDTKYSSLAFGSIEYNGKAYNSAVVGAETLPIKDGATYIWVFKAF